jgi:hypothetical protein
MREKVEGGEVEAQGGGFQRTVDIPRLTVPTNFRIDMVRAAMVCTVQLPDRAWVALVVESFGVG